MAYRIYKRREDEERELVTTSRYLNFAVAALGAVDAKAGDNEAVYMLNRFGVVGGYDFWSRYLNKVMDAPLKDGKILLKDFEDAIHDNVYFGNL